MVIAKTQKTVAVVFTLFLGLYALFGFYGLPYLVVNKLPEILQEQTGQPASLQACKFNPFTFHFEVNGFSQTGGDGKPLLNFELFAIEFNAWRSLTQQAIVFDNIVLQKPIINIKREKNGTFNFSSMIPKAAENSAEPKKPSSPPALTIGNLEINMGAFGWEDVSNQRPQTAKIQPVNLKIADLTTKLNGKGHFDLGFELASGGRLQWQGELSVEPLSSTGSISLEQLNLGNLWQEFLQTALPIAVPAGSLNVHTDYQANLIENNFNLVLDKGEVGLKDLKITEKGKANTLVSVPTMDMRGIELDLEKQKVSVKTLESKNVLINASLEADGRVNFQRIFTAEHTPATSTGPVQQTHAPATAEKQWQVALGELALSNYDLQFIDQTRKTPQHFELSAINFTLQKIIFPHTEKLPMQLSASLNNDGKLKITGELGLNPVSTALTIDIKNIKLKALQNYVNDYVKLQIVDGIFNSNGQLNMTAAEELQLQYTGNLDVANLVTRDQISNKDFLKWTDLSLQQINVDLAKQTFDLAKVLLDHPYLRVTIQKDRTTNLSGILVSQPDKKAKAAEPAEKPKSEKNQMEPVISIGKIELDAGYSDFSDYSLILPFVTEMDELNGEIDGFNSNQDKPLKLNLKGKVYHLAVVNIKGTYQLKNMDSDIGLKFDHMPLPLITPYMADFAGYKIEKGQMALDLQYKINKGQLDAQNKIFIDQLTLGDQVENPHATSLPLKLAIALLKDADGKINLDFPVTGSLDDPQFSVGSLIADVLGNLISKLVTSPFRALEGWLDDDQDYSTIKFADGSADLQPAEMTKLDQLSKALQSKPELTLDIKGKSNQNQDWPVIRFDALKEILRKMKSGELRDKGQTIRSEYIELTEEEYKRLLEKFFREVFPQDIDHTVLGKPRIKSQPDADFYEAAKQKMEDILQPEPERLNNLAITRANSISKYLVEKGNIDLGRLYLLSPEIDTSNADDSVSVLSLNVAH